MKSKYILNTILILSTIFISFTGGMLYTLESHNDSIEHYLSKIDLIETQRWALLEADALLSKHNIWDIDDSYTMKQYLDLSTASDSIYNKIY